MAEWFTAVGTIFLGVVALFVALFQEHVRRFMFKPKLGVLGSNFHPYCLKEGWMREGVSFVNRPHYRLRIGVVNNGNTKAESVQIFAKKLERQDGHGLYVRVSPFIERYVLWSDAESQTLDVLNPGFTAYAHLGNVFSTTDVPDNVRALAESVREGNLGTRTVLSLFPSGSWGQLFAPGKYQLTVIIGAANADLIEKILEVDLTGNWPGVEIGPERVGEIVKFGVL